MAEQLSTNPKLFFQYANSQNKVKAQLPYLKLSDGRCTQNMIESANELNAYFVSVFSESSRITETTTNINIVENPLYSLYKFNTEQVRLRLLSLNNRKAAGPDGISNTILKQNSYALAPHLTVLFQHSLDKGIVPDEWKDANVTPIHKSGATDVAANYRPISLTFCVCKVMERFVYDWISTYLRLHSPLHSSQHGFQQSQSCTTQLLEYCNDITLSLDCKECMDVIYLDFSKAFDKISHSLLLLKLE